jgi:hypothetical protein
MTLDKVVRISFHLDKLLFAAHRGTYCGHRAAVIMPNTCLPIAAAESSCDAPYGFVACWEAAGEPVEFFEAIGITSVEAADDNENPGGIWVFENDGYTDDEAEAFQELDPNEENTWGHLAHGLIRRPHESELLKMAKGEPPWPGGAVL